MTRPSSGNRPVLDSDKITAGDIDTGPQSPQMAFNVWKGPGWKDFARVFPFATGAFFIFVGLVILKDPEDAKMAPVMFTIAGLLFLTFIPLRPLCKGQYRVGIDGKTDTLWFARGNRVTAFEVHASRITGVSYTDQETVRLNTLWHLNPSMPLVWRNREWLMTVNRTTSEFTFGVSGSGLATAQEAAQVAEGANALLRSRAGMK